MKSRAFNLRFFTVGLLLGWIVQKILNHNQWGEKPIVNDMIFFAMLLVLVASFSRSILKGAKAYKSLKQPDISAEELAGINRKQS